MTLRIDSVDNLPMEIVDTSNFWKTTANQTMARPLKDTYSAFLLCFIQVTEHAKERK